jgi:hypothetical protein
VAAQDFLDCGEFVPAILCQIRFDGLSVVVASRIIRGRGDKLAMPPAFSTRVYYGDSVAIDLLPATERLGSAFEDFLHQGLGFIPVYRSAFDSFAAVIFFTHWKK